MGELETASVQPSTGAQAQVSWTTTRSIVAWGRPCINRRKAAAGGAKVRRLALVEARGHPLHLAIVDIVAQSELTTSPARG